MNNSSVVTKALDADNVIDELAALPCETNGVEDLEAGCCRTCRARNIRAALSSQVAAEWRLVPKEPTREMDYAGHDKFIDVSLPRYTGLDPHREIWNAMLAAAPTKQRAEG